MTSVLYSPALRAEWLAGFVFTQPRAEYGQRVVMLRHEWPAAHWAVGAYRIRESAGSSGGSWDVEQFDARAKSAHKQWSAVAGATKLRLETAKSVAARLIKRMPAPAPVVVSYTGNGPLKREPNRGQTYGPCVMTQARNRIRDARKDGPLHLIDYFSALGATLTIRPDVPDGTDHSTSTKDATTVPNSRNRKPKSSVSEDAVRALRENAAGTAAVADAPVDSTPVEPESPVTNGTESEPLTDATPEHPAELSDSTALAIRASADAEPEPPADGEAPKADPDASTPDATPEPVKPNLIVLGDSEQVWTHLAGESADDEVHRVYSQDTVAGVFVPRCARTAGTTFATGTPAEGQAVACAYCAEGSERPVDARAPVAIRRSTPPDAQHKALTDALGTHIATLVSTLTAQPNATDARVAYDALTKAVAELRPMVRTTSRASATSADGTAMRVRNASPLRKPVSYTAPDGTVTHKTLADAAKDAARDYKAPACVDYEARCGSTELNARVFLKRDLAKGALTSAQVSFLDEVPAETPATE